MEWLADPAAWTALATLLVLEVVLGVDNVVFISILASKLPEEEQDRARKVGILAAGGMRVLLLLLVGWIVTLENELFALSIGGEGDDAVFHHGFAGKDLILLAGGAFLIYKATKEIHDRLEGVSHHAAARGTVTFASVIVQVLLLDAVFSIDSVITAVGMTDHVPVMVLAVLTAVVIMLFASKAIYAFVNEHPTVKMLALSFLLMIGMMLVAEGTGQHIPKGYLYSAIAFSIFVEMLNLRMRARAGQVRERQTVALHQPQLERANDRLPAES